MTVVTPTFNRAGLLPETIDSILAQTFQDFEYLLIDDGSTDGTRDVADSYGERLGYRYHDNRGEAASTNRGWDEARGEYFAMVSSDDPMMPDWLEESVAFMDEHPDVLVGYPDWNMIDDSSKIIKTVRVYDYEPERLFGWVHCLPGPGALIRRVALPQGYQLREPRLRYVSDLESWFKLAMRGRFARIPKILATWRLHDESASIGDANVLRARETIDTVRNFYRSNQLPPELQALQRLAVSRAYYLASVAVGGRRMFQAAYYYLVSRVLMPIDKREMPPEIRRFSIARAARRLRGPAAWTGRG